MNKNLFHKYKKAWIWLESVLIVTLLLGFLYKTCGVYFETIDDRAINDIFAGVLTGKPDGHAVFVNYLFGALMAALYAMNINVAWYGLFLIACHFVVYVLFTGILLEQTETLLQHIGVVISTCFLVAANMYIFGEIQYTSTASILAAMGYFCLLFDKKSPKRKYLLFFIFECLALLLRSQAMFMIQIVGISVVGLAMLVSLLQREWNLKEFLKRISYICGILCVCLLLSWIGNYVIGDYADEEWRAYTHYRELRGDMGDYYGFPAYEEVSHIFDATKDGYSENEYLAFTRYWILQNEIDIDALEQVHKIAEERYKASRGSLKDVLQWLKTSRNEQGIMGYGDYTKILYLVVLLLAVLCNKWDVWVPVLGLNLGRNIALGYLSYRGRIPFRASSGLYFIELLILVSYLYYLIKECRGKHIIYKLLVCLLVLCVIKDSVIPMRDSYRYLRNQHTSKEIMSKGMDDIIAYCDQADAGFLAVELATAYYMGEALETDWNVNRNYLSSGLWWSTSPNVAIFQKEYLEKHKDNLYLIEMGEGMDPWESYAKELFESDWGLSLDFAEHIQLQNGIVLDVYKVNNLE